ncbi:cysteine desulfurase IscS [Nonlabens sp. Hel1_33_55]|uniref:cysteine desulfurase family protein n=1 Tax=Nonlabens sp. Hel1_33_55 TaxID=1336802 RepID=UPI000875C78D|nr:cysteine desulfurase family protein [Nonlabens sp. Hel1_33_55]SCX98952.1 cysteine desulfurase IscS [Nonlabens sp. Hel1_33_55]
MVNTPKVYLDYNATTPVDQRVVDAMIPYFTENFGNSGSDHVYGWEAQEAVDLARKQVSKLIGAKPSEIIFTSGATEAANMALQGYCKAQKHKRNHIITCKTEHKAVLDPINQLEQNGFDVTYLDVDYKGNINVSDLENAIKEQTVLVCLMLANNETGLIHPIKEIAKVVRKSYAVLMCDITQAVGKVNVDIHDLDIDIAFFSAHKMYGPKGAGALFLNKNNQISIDPSFYGGGQEKGMRPGTLNIPAIVGFGKAADISFAKAEKESRSLSSLRDQLEGELQDIPGAIINCQNESRLPNTTSISFKNTDGNKLIRRLKNIAVSRGSACTSVVMEPSHVLSAMGLEKDLAMATLRISIGHPTTEQDIHLAVAEIKSAVNALQFAEL